MQKSKLVCISIVTLLLVSLSIGLVSSQYSTEKTTQIQLDSHGFEQVTVEELDVTYVVDGVPGATGSIITSVYSGNPQTSASYSNEIGLSKFTVITFDMDPTEFTSATVTFNYSDSDVENLQPPYSIYKYLPESDSYVEMPTTADLDAKTLTITLTSVDDPLFAIGGTKIVESTDGSTMWILIIAIAIVVIIGVLFLVVRLRNSGKL